MYFFNVFYDLIANFFSFFLLDLFVSFYLKDKTKQQKLRLYFMAFQIIYAFIQTSGISLLGYFVCFLYVFLSTKLTLLKKIWLFIKYYLYIYFSNFLIAIVHLLIFRDLNALLSNPVYLQYNSLIGAVTPYIFASLYVNHKKLHSLNTGKAYMYQYNFISLTALAVLIASTFLLESGFISSEELVPVIFALILIIIAVCLANYRRIILTMEENAMNKLQLEKTDMERNYYAQIDKKLEQLHTLRHDMKNHLILIDGYAEQKDFTKIQEYIREISSEFKQTQAVTTSNTTISSLLNAKKSLCDESNISLQLDMNFDLISLDDFTIITILGNLLDNAITAASKVADGFIKLSIEQIDTYLSIHCTNNHCEKIIKKEGRFISSKPSNYSDKSFNNMHGLGIVSVTRTVEQLNGTVNFDYDEHTFTAAALVPNYIN